MADRFGEKIKIGSAVFTVGVIFLVLLVLFLSYVLRHTAYGRHIYAVGDDPEAAELAAPEDKIKHLRSFGPSVVILTHGASGASGFPGNGDRVDVAACKVDIVDTVGAGDTFNAGVLAKLGGLNLLSKPALAGIGSGPISQALEYGSKVAAITVSRAGANPPWSHEITSRK